MGLKRQVSAPRVPRLVTLGSDYSGLEPATTAMNRMGVSHKLVFASDTNPACEKYIKHAHVPGKFFQDVLERKPAEEEYVDIYVWTPPCTDFSRAGMREGITGKSKCGLLIKKSLLFIKNKRPRIAIFENVPALVEKKFLKIAKGICKALKEMGYTVKSAILNSCTYGVPQSRRRLYIAAILKDGQRHDFQWPKRLPSKAVSLESILDPKVASDKPGVLPKAKGQRKRAISAFKAAYEKGTDPRKVPVMVDIDASEQYMTFGMGICKTITRARGSVGGPWVCTRSPRTTANELIKLMGYRPSEVPYKAAGITDRQLGAMIGNGVVMPVMGRILAEAMWSGGLVSAKPEFR